MARFRLKDVEFEAERYRDGMEDEWAHLGQFGVLTGRFESRSVADSCRNQGSSGSFGNSVPVVKTPTGRVPVWPGDWIAENGRGERHVLTPDELFGADYVFVASGRPALDTEGAQSGEGGYHLEMRVTTSASPVGAADVG